MARSRPADIDDTADVVDTEAPEGVAVATLDPSPRVPKVGDEVFLVTFYRDTPRL